MTAQICVQIFVVSGVVPPFMCCMYWHPCWEVRMAKLKNYSASLVRQSTYSAKFAARGDLIYVKTRSSN